MGLREAKKLNTFNFTYGNENNALSSERPKAIVRKEWNPYELESGKHHNELKMKPSRKKDRRLSYKRDGTLLSKK